MGEYGPTDDPRQYFMKRKRSLSLHGRPKRIKSEFLPLEQIPRGTMTHNISTTSELCINDIVGMMELFASSDSHLAPEDLAISLKFRDMSEARSAEGRLRKAEDTWVEDANMQVEVEYCLQSEAKGKRKA